MLRFKNLTGNFPENVGKKFILATSRDVHAIKFENTFWDIETFGTLSTARRFERPIS